MQKELQNIIFLPVQQSSLKTVWKLKKAFVKDIIEEINEPTPPYNTISSVVRILKDKGFVDFKAYGKTYQYFPRVSKLQYKKFTFSQMLRNYFDGSYQTMVSYMVDEEKISDSEISEIKRIIEDKAK